MVATNPDDPNFLTFPDQNPILGLKTSLSPFSRLLQTVILFFCVKKSLSPPSRYGTAFPDPLVKKNPWPF